MKNVLWIMLFLLACSAEKPPTQAVDYWKDFIVFEPEYDGPSLAVSQDFQGNKFVIDTIRTVKEASGIVSSNKNKGMAWTHNDSGNDPELILLDLQTGEELCRFTDSTMQNVDWEDIAIYLDKNGKSWIIVADIGDNQSIRTNVRLLYIPEPIYTSDLKGTTQVLNLNVSIRFFIYPKGSRDAEAIFVDPERGDVYVISKRDARSGVYALPYKSDFSKWDTAIYCGSFPFNLVTAADLSMHRQLTVRTYLDLYYWKWEPGSDLRAVLALAPSRLPYDQTELQGESISFSQDGKSFYLLGEELFGQKPVLCRWN